MIGRLGDFKVKLTLTNTGDRDGAQVVQVYIAPPESPVARPARELKGFAKVWLKAGESKSVSANSPDHLSKKFSGELFLNRKQYVPCGPKYHISATQFYQSIRNRDQ